MQSVTFVHATSEIVGSPEREPLLKAQKLHSCRPVSESPLDFTEVARPVPGDRHLLLKVRVCGLCHTDLHIVEGDLPLPRLPLIPGHQIVGIVEETGNAVTRFKREDRVGVPWLHTTCGTCDFCGSGRENLCDNAQFTGYHVDGGYAEFVVVSEDSAYALPESFSDTDVAPLLCAGVIGYRALRLSGIKPGGRVGLFGFGASAHIAIQIVRHWGGEAYVFTRNRHHRALAEALGASWTGAAEDRPPHQIESGIIFAPAGALVPAALGVLQKGGTLALAGIHMSRIPEMEYGLLYHERTVRSVANSTRDDVRGLLDVASRIPVRTEVEVFPLREINRALLKLKNSELHGSGVVAV